MTNKLTIKISGGENRFDHIEQGDQIAAEGPIVLNYSPALFNDSRSSVEAAATALGIADDERDALKQRLAELEAQIKVVIKGIIDRLNLLQDAIYGRSIASWSRFNLSMMPFITISICSTRSSPCI